MKPAHRSDPLTVAIIAEREASERILELADQVHVWAVDTTDNRRAAEKVWRRREAQGELSMTVFLFDEGSPDRIVANALEAIDLHHDERSQVPPWSRALVFGAAPTPLLLSAFRRIGFDVFSKQDGGFRASRSKAAKTLKTPANPALQ